MKQHCHMTREAGFTLIEVLVAMVVLSIGLLGVASMQVVATQVNGVSNGISRGIVVAQDKLEELMVLDYGDAALADATAEGIFTTYTEAAPPTGFRVTWQVDRHPDNETKTINVTAQWQRSGSQKSFTVSYLKTEFN